jgi:hypothetical protein
VTGLASENIEFNALMIDHIERAVDIIEELQNLLEDNFQNSSPLSGSAPNTPPTIKFSKKKWLKIQRKTQRLLAELRDVRVTIDRDLLVLGV